MFLPCWRGKISPEHGILTQAVPSEERLSPVAQLCEGDRVSIRMKPLCASLLGVGWAAAGSHCCVSTASGRTQAQVVHGCDQDVPSHSAQAQWESTASAQGRGGFSQL